MKSARLCVPYLIVSSVLKADDSVEQRIQTPFGSVDIVLSTAAVADGGAPIRELRIEADMSLEPFPADFSDELYENLANFSYDIVRQSMIAEAYRRCDLCLRFKNSQIVRHFVRDYAQGCWRGLEE